VSRHPFWTTPVETMPVSPAGINPDGGFDAAVAGECGCLRALPCLAACRIRARTYIEVRNPAEMPPTKDLSPTVEKLSKRALTGSGGSAYKPPIETAPPLSGASSALH
jgi:hypothetical protein